MRCFAVGCLGGGGGGCKVSVEGVGVDSVDKEHRGVRVDTIRRRGACRTDNMLHTLQGRRFGMGMPSRPTGYGPIRIRELPISHMLDYTTHWQMRKWKAGSYACMSYILYRFGWSSVDVYRRFPAAYPRLCALNPPSRLFRTPSTGASAELTPPGLSAGNVKFGFFSLGPPTLSPPAVQRASMIDLMLHSHVKKKMGVQRSTLRTGNRSGYRAGGRNTISIK